MKNQTVENTTAEQNNHISSVNESESYFINRLDVDIEAIVAKKSRHKNTTSANKLKQSDKKARGVNLFSKMQLYTILKTKR